MEIYLVGGAVRDKLLGHRPKDNDYVVIGESIASMLSAGFKEVGDSFPVFLKDGEEYALARKERKIEPGYKGFIVDASSTVTLVEDLFRRDLTINAIALGNDGNYIDPHNGITDLKNKVLRHVSDAFDEDPVRVLRVARFMARYPDFTIAEETMALMKKLALSGELDHLTPERVWLETEKTLGEPHPDRFFDTLKECGALEIIFPEIHALSGVPQPEKWHPEIDTYVHVMMALKQCCQLTESTVVRFSVLVHDLGKALSPKEDLPSHHEHEKTGIPVYEKMSKRLKIPNIFNRLALAVIKGHTRSHKALEMKCGKVTDMLSDLGAFGNNSLLNDFLLACQADATGRLGMQNDDYPQARFLKDAQSVALDIDTQPILERYKGKEIGEQIRFARIDKVNHLIKSGYFLDDDSSTLMM